MPLVAHWPLLEVGSTVVRDARGPNDGVWAGTVAVPAPAARPKGMGYLFNGTADRVAIADAAALDVTSITIATWVKLDSAWAAAGQIFSKMDDYLDGQEFSYALYVLSTKRIQFIASDDGNVTGLGTIISTTAIDVNVWTHLVASYNEVDDVFKLYINGVNTGDTGDGRVEGAIHIGTGRCAIGARSDAEGAAYSTFFKGCIADVRLYNHVLSASEVRELYEISNGLTRGRRGEVYRRLG